MRRYDNAHATAAADTPIVPVARYSSACDIAWHKCVQQTVLQVSGVVPVVTKKKEVAKAGPAHVWASSS